MEAEHSRQREVGRKTTAGQRRPDTCWARLRPRAGLRASALLQCGLVAAALMWATGCGTGWHARQAARGPQSATTRKAPVPTAQAEAEAALEQRVGAYAHFAAGVVHDTNGESDRAQEEFWKAALADPGHERLVIDMARRLIQRQQAEKAVELLTKSSALPKATGVVFAWLGFAQAQLGQTEAAIAADRLAIKKAPRLLMGYHNLAQIHLQKKAPQEALKILDEAARQTEVSATFLVDLAEILAGASRAKSLSAEAVKPRVLAVLERAAKLQPLQPLLLQKMADSYKAVGELGKATVLYQDLLKNHPPSNPAFAPVLREQLFQLYLRSGDKAKAAEQLREILRDNPTNPQAYYLLGNLASEEKKFSEAAEHFEKALLFDEKLEPAYYDLAGVRLAQNQPLAAVETLKRARARFASNFVLEFYSGLAQAALKQYGEALKSYISAEVLAKAGEPARLNHVFYFQFGSAYERSGDFATAEKQFRKCLQLEPEFDEALNYLGYMWAERGVNLEEARQMIAKALTKEPKNAAFLDSMAWVLFKLKRTEEALKYMQKAMQNSEKPDATLYDHLGDIHAALGHAEQARAAWRKSLEIEPNDQIKRKLETSAGGK